MRLLILIYTLFFTVVSIAEDVSPSLDEVQQIVSQGDYAIALEKLQDIIQREPNNTEARFLSGVVHAQLGNTDKAVHVFNELTRQFPELSEPYNNLAVLYASQHEYEKARDALQHALKIQPDYDTAHENLGDVYIKMAAMSYEQSFSINSRNRRAQSKADIIAKILESRIKRGELIAIQYGPVSGDTVAATKPMPVKKPGDWQPVTAPPASPADQPASSTASRKPPSTLQRCYETGPVRTATELNNMMAWLQGKNAVVEKYKRPSEMDTYKVYLAPVESRALAEGLIAKLKRSGIKDVFRIPSGRLQNAIAVGVYSLKTSAINRQRQLHDLGFDTQIKKQRSVIKRHWLMIDANRAESEVAPLPFSRKFPGFSLSKIGCR